MHRRNNRLVNALLRANMELSEDEYEIGGSITVDRYIIRDI